MSRIRFFLSALIVATQFIQPARATERQAPAAIQKAVEDFMRAQSVGLAGETQFAVGLPDARLALPACTELEPFLHGGRIAANTMVGVRCRAPNPWTIYVQVRVKSMGEVIVAARALGPGQTIGPGDLVTQKVDMQQQAQGVYTDPEQLIGKVLNAGVGAGQPLRQDMLRLLPVIQQGQSVKLMAQGRGFQVSSEGSAMGQAAEGRVVQVRLGSGQVLSGIARPGAIVEVQF